MIHLTKNKLFILLLIHSLLLSSCLPKLHVNRMKLNDELGFYTYPYNNADITLRNEYGLLVTRENIKPFLETIESNNMRYNFPGLSEQTDVVSQKDEELVSVYASLISSINLKNIEAATFYIAEMRRLYPGADYYTDLFFLEGRLAEMRGDTVTAKNCYLNFYTFSEKKYSGFFRGNMFNDSAKKCFLEQRKFAKVYTSNQLINNTIECHTAPVHKYYYQSFSKGFVLNREDYRESTRILPGFMFTYRNSYGILTGAHVSWLLSEKYCANAQLLYSKYQSQFNLSFPIQIYKNFNNRFGLKLTPIIESAYIQKFFDDKKANRFFLNPGVSLSAGYTILPRLNIGASVTAFYYNENNTKLMLNHTVFNQNTLTAGVQYLIIKNIALRADLINGKPVLGFNLSGAFLGYDFFSNYFGLFKRDY